MNQLLPYETIVKASEGDPEAVAAVLSHYAGYALDTFRVRSDGAFGKSRACRSPVRTITDGTGNHFLVLLPTIDA